MNKVEGGQDGEYRAKPPKPTNIDHLEDAIKALGNQEEAAPVGGVLQEDTLLGAQEISTQFRPPQKPQDVGIDNPVLPPPHVTNEASDGLEAFRENNWFKNNYAAFVVMMREWSIAQMKARAEEGELQAKQTAAQGQFTIAKAKTTIEIGWKTFVQSIASAATNGLTATANLYASLKTMGAEKVASSKFDEETAKLENNLLYKKEGHDVAYKKYTESEKDFKLQEQKIIVQKSDIEKLKNDPNTPLAEKAELYAGTHQKSKELAASEKLRDEYKATMEEYAPGFKNTEKLLKDKNTVGMSTNDKDKLVSIGLRTKTEFDKRPEIRLNTISTEVHNITTQWNGIIQTVTAAGRSADELVKGTIELEKSKLDAQRQFEELLAQLSAQGREGAQTFKNQFSEDFKSIVEWLNRMAEAQTRLSNISNR